MISAEGNHLATSGADFVRITQRDGGLQDAIKLAVYLEGYRPSVSKLIRNEIEHSPAAHIGMCRSHVSPSSFTIETLEAQPVWCVSTELGSWTMQQDGQIMLTGNSNQAHYGGITSDPVMQIIEGIRYIEDRYGSIGNVPGVRSVSSGGPYVPYDGGGWLMPGGRAINLSGRPERILSPNETAAGSAGNTYVINAPLGGITPETVAEIQRKADWHRRTGHIG
jgi:hypothetical protein